MWGRVWVVWNFTKDGEVWEYALFSTKGCGAANRVRASHRHSNVCAVCVCVRVCVCVCVCGARSPEAFVYLGHLHRADRIVGCAAPSYLSCSIRVGGKPRICADTDAPHREKLVLKSVCTCGEDTVVPVSNVYGKV